ncbi:hypothetical protein [Polaromonas jejuensis]|nr:hypothetical protein [Polaromonas jejuensis]
MDPQSSALCVLCVQKDATDRVIDMLRDAMGEFQPGVMAICH